MEQTTTSGAGGIHACPPGNIEPRAYARYRTTDRVLKILLDGDLARLRADSVAASLGMSATTLRRRLRAQSKPNSRFTPDRDSTRTVKIPTTVPKGKARHSNQPVR